MSTSIEDTGSAPDSFLRAAAATRSLPMPAEAGSLVGRYRVESLLGRGGMGVVHRAADTILGRAVALKVLHITGSAADDLLREARLAARLDHPNVATVFDAGIDDGRVFIAMELVEGVSLRARMRTGLSSTEARAIARDIAAALAHAHARGVVHRDLKPENVMVGPRGAKLVDFGIATPTSEETAAQGRRHGGTPGYMAPEREASPAADVYAFGVLLHELLTGRRPGEPAPPIAAPLSELVRRCLAEPALRPDLPAIDAALAPRERRKTFTLGVGAFAAVALVGVLAARSPWSAPTTPTLVVVAPATASPAASTAAVPQPSPISMPSPSISAVVTAGPRSSPAAPLVRAASVGPEKAMAPPKTTAAPRTGTGGACHLSSECTSGWCVAEVCR